VSVLFITHSLNNALKDYTPFYDAIKGNCTHWWHYFDSTWIVATQHGAHPYTRTLKPPTAFLWSKLLQNIKAGFQPKRGSGSMQERISLVEIKLTHYPNLVSIDVMRAGGIGCRASCL
jgi:hypothetical protein